MGRFIWLVEYSGLVGRSFLFTGLDAKSQLKIGIFIDWKSIFLYGCLGRTQRNAFFPGTKTPKPLNRPFWVVYGCRKKTQKVTLEQVNISPDFPSEKENPPTGNAT